MPHQPFRFEAYPTLKPSQPPSQQTLSPDVLRGKQPTQPPVQPPEQLEPIRVTPTPRLRTDARPVSGALAMVPKASMIPRSSPRTWQQPGTE